MDPAAIFPNNSSPFDVEVVFKEILEFVGTDHESLLTCRLVSHAWNEMALVVLGQHGTTIGNNSDCDEVWNVDHEHEKKLKPDPMEKTQQWEPVSLAPLVFVPNLTTAFEKIGAKLHIPVAHLEFTKRIRVAPSIAITSISGSSVLDQDLWKLVRGCASTLTSIKIFMGPGGSFPLPAIANNYPLNLRRTLHHMRNPEPQKQLDSIIDILGGVSFPRLVNISARTNGICEIIHLISMHFAASSPNLRRFKFESNLGLTFLNDQDQDSDWARENANKFSKWIPSNSSPDVYQLEIPLTYIETITPAYFPGLQSANAIKLILSEAPKHGHEICPAVVERAVRGFIKLNNLQASILICLQLRINDSPEWIVGASRDLENQGVTRRTSEASTILPDSPDCRPQVLSLNLVQFTLASVPGTDMCENSIGFLCSALICFIIYFPNLTSINVEERVLCHLLTSKTDITYVGRCVERLFVSGLNNTNKGILLSDAGTKQITTGINALFPVLKEIIVEFDVRCEIFSRLKYQRLHFPSLPSTVPREFKGILHAIMKTRGIKSLKFKMYNTNFLGSPDFGLEGSELAESLEHLELNLPTHKRRSDDNLDFIRLAELGTLIKALPNLKVLVVDSKLVVDKAGGSDFSSIMEELLQLRGQFPQVDIKIM